MVPLDTYGTCLGTHSMPTSGVTTTTMDYAMLERRIMLINGMTYATFRVPSKLSEYTTAYSIPTTSVLCRPVPAPPPKNWRWYDVFRTFEEKKTCPDDCRTPYFFRKNKKGCSQKQVRDQKRKSYIERLKFDWKLQ